MGHVLKQFLLFSFVFFSTRASQQHNVCSRPELADNIKMDGIQRYFSPGAQLTLSCKQGHYAVFDPRTIVCTASGQWTRTRMKCIPKSCPFPDMPSNGDVHFTDVEYQSVINYTCHEGYILTGASSSVCQANGTWSAAAPECKPVSCGIAPVPQFGMIVYDKKVRGNTTYYGVTGTYKCLPPYVLIGNARAECTASGNWTKLPECQVVTCPPPENIDKGYMTSHEKRNYSVMETVRYGCHGDYKLDGIFTTVCLENGEWSKKPSCKAPCSVGIQRGRILYQGQKLWIADLKPKRVLHKDIVSFYCKDEVRGCGYSVPTQCIDGNLPIPECFKEPSSSEYNFNSRYLPSEIQQC